MTDLADLAAQQLDRGGPHASRRACWLARSALEDRIEALLTVRGLLAGDRASARSRLTCLEAVYADRPDLVARAQYLWSRLSEACHEHAYQLSPTAAEARSLVDGVAALGVPTDP